MIDYSLTDEQITELRWTHRMTPDRVLADRHAQEQFLEEYRKLRENKGENDTFLFMDGCHPIHNSAPDYGWIRKGQERELKADTERRRLNINGVYDIDIHEWLVVFSKTVNAQSTCELFNKIEKKYSDAEHILRRCEVL